MGIGSLGFVEMAVIFVIALIVFGPRKLPELGRSLGSAMREFRRSLNELQREFEEADPTRTVRKELGSVRDTLRDESRSILAPDRTPVDTEPAPADAPTPADANTGSVAEQRRTMASEDPTDTESG